MMCMQTTRAYQHSLAARRDGVHGLWRRYRGMSSPCWGCKESADASLTRLHAVGSAGKMAGQGTCSSHVSEVPTQQSFSRCCPCV